MPSGRGGADLFPAPGETLPPALGTPARHGGRQAGHRDPGAGRLLRSSRGARRAPAALAKRDVTTGRVPCLNQSNDFASLDLSVLFF